MVTDTVTKVAEAFNCKPVEGKIKIIFFSIFLSWFSLFLGMLSHQLTKNVIDGEKINNSKSQ